MQKFSNITGQKVSSEKIIKSNETSEMLELENFKYSIMNLMDKNLIIRNEGNYRQATIISKIDGKEIFIEALLDFLTQKENKKAISYLESLKESIGDWKSIDDKIDQIKDQDEKMKYLSNNSSHVEQIISFFEKYSLSEDFADILDNQLLKITDYEVALNRHKVALLMLESDKYNKYPKNRIRAISNKFLFRSKQLI